VVPFASGGIVSSPTLFKFAGGTGLMGEAGPEAIMPLKRGRGGKLGVAAGGGLAPMNLTVNIDSRTDAATIAATVSRAVVAGQQQMLEYLRAQGAM
jgi:phage-related minor tail protein